MKRVFAAILGHRELTTVEVNLIAQLRKQANELGDLIRQVENHVSEQHEHAQASEDVDEMERLTNAEPFKWLESAKTSIQTGVMHAARALAQPTDF